MSRLWVRNLIGIVVVAAAAAILCAVDLYPQWSSYRQTIVPQHVISHGASMSAYGETWRLGSVRRVAELPNRPYEASVPQGATLTVVTIERSGPPITGSCVGVITDGRRRWKDQSSSGVVYPLSIGATEFCNKPGALQFDFLLPSSIAPSAVDITDANNAILLRIML